MELLFFLAPFVVLGIGVLFVAFSGGPGRARQAYLTRRAPQLPARAGAHLRRRSGSPSRLFVITGREESVGASGSLAATEADAELEEGKTLFLQNCSSCHSLDAANARGVTGPDLDELAPLEEDRVLSAIEIGGTGENRMPAGLLEGENADRGGVRRPRSPAAERRATAADVLGAAGPAAPVPLAESLERGSRCGPGSAAPPPGIATARHATAGSRPRADPP